MAVPETSNTRGQNLDVIVVGGGIAGIAAARSLETSGYRVTLIEARSTLGGRLGSHSGGELPSDFDNGPHLFLSTYSRTRRLLKSLKLGDALAFPWPGSIPFAGVRTSRTVLRQWILPAPWNFAGGLLSFRGLSLAARRRTVLTAFKLMSASETSSQSVGEWLKEHWGAEDRDVFWLPLIRASLNSPPDTVSIRYLRTVLKEGFCKGFFGGRLGYAREPLGRIFGEKIHRALEKSGIRVLLRAPVVGATVEDDRVRALQLKNGRTLQCDAAILALPPWALEKWLSTLLQGNAVRAVYSTRAWQASSISSVYLWSEHRPILDPFTCLPGTTAEWLFDFARLWEDRRGPVCMLLGNQPVRATEGDDLSPLLMESASALPQLQRVHWDGWKRITERRAIPLRPRDLWGKTLPQTTPIANLYLAGDWLDELPPTVEAAVRSGERVAQMISTKQ
jgi:phytoene dehydrogenase-like protein